MSRSGTSLGDFCIGNEVTLNKLNIKEIKLTDSELKIEAPSGTTVSAIDQNGNFKTIGNYELYGMSNDLTTSSNRFQIALDGVGDFVITDVNQGINRMTIDASTGITTFNPPLGGTGSIGSTGPTGPILTSALTLILSTG